MKPSVRSNLPQLHALMGLAALLAVANSAMAQCPPIPSASQIADPYAGQAPPAPAQITTTSRVHIPNGDASYCLYTPPAGKNLGVILYLHGAQFIEDGKHDPMLQWFADVGYYIVYPYITDPTHYPTQARDALAHGIDELTASGIPVTNVAIAGFSLGGLASVRVAALWSQQNLQPAIRAIVLHDPAGMDFLWLLDIWGEYDLSTAGLSPIRCNTRLLIIQAQTSVGDPNSGALHIWNNLPQLAKYAGTTGTAGNRNFLRIPHDASHQNRAPFVTLESNHEVVDAFPLTSMDWYGYWAPLFGTVWEAFTGSPFLSYSPLCNSPSTTGTCTYTRDMGTWEIDNVDATTMLNAADLSLLGSLPNYCP